MEAALPIPKPRLSGDKPETEQEFVSRCMGDPTMNTDYPKQPQRAAVCYSTYRDAKKPKPAAAAPGKAVAPADCMPQTDETAAEFMDRCIAGGDTQAACMMAWNENAPAKAAAPPSAKPAPAAGESRDAFMGRCMRDPSMKGHGNPMAACVALWDAGGKALEGMVTKSTVRLNTTGESKARGLVDAGKVSDAAWSFSADDGNALLGGADGTDWAAYAAYHLGEDTAETPKTRARYKYPFGKGGQVYLSALRAIRSRTSQQGATSVFDAAGRLLDAATKKQNSAPARATVPAAVERGVEMKWMPTHLENIEFKRLDGDRTFSGTATTIDQDAMGDVVVSRGAQFTLPVPLLLHHDHKLPVGYVTFAQPNDKGIPFTAKIPRIQEDGALKQRTDEAYQSLRHRIIRGVSIGFTAIPDQTERMKSGGLKFNRWRWHELSLVVVPANQHATVDVIRSLDERARGLDVRPVHDPVIVSAPRLSVPLTSKVVTKQDPVTCWINDFANRREWHRLLDERPSPLQSESHLAKRAAVNIRLRQPTGDITQEQIQFEAWELRRYW